MANTPGPSSFDRVPLIFGIRVRATGVFAAADLFPLALNQPTPERYVGESLLRLTQYGLIEITSKRSLRTLKWRRTQDGLLLGLRLLDDRRISFERAIGSQRFRGLPGPIGPTLLDPDDEP